MHLSPAFLRALLDAEHYHHDQKRKDTQIPYISHLLGVCSIALEAEATDTEAIAALLHDAPEDAGGELILKAIEANFGPEVAEIVRECSDSLTAKGEEKPPWLVRKKEYLTRLKTAGVSAMLVSASDKLHNLRAIASDRREIGDKIWDRFNTPEPKKDHSLWYYGSLRDVYASADSPSDPRRKRLVDAISDLLDQLGYTGDFEPSFVKP